MQSCKKGTKLQKKRYKAAKKVQSCKKRYKVAKQVQVAKKCARLLKSELGQVQGYQKGAELQKRLLKKWIGAGARLLKRCKDAKKCAKLKKKGY